MSPTDEPKTFTILFRFNKPKIDKKKVEHPNTFYVAGMSFPVSEAWEKKTCLEDLTADERINHIYSTILAHIVQWGITATDICSNDELYEFCKEFIQIVSSATPAEKEVLAFHSYFKLAEKGYRIDMEDYKAEEETNETEPEEKLAPSDSPVEDQGDSYTEQHCPDSRE